VIRNSASAGAHHSDLAPLQELPGQLTGWPHPSGPPGSLTRCPRTLSSPCPRQWEPP